MINKVELLRSVLFTKEDFENITNLDDKFTEKDVEFMIEFKKIYELGLIQLEKFVKKLDEEGKYLDTYSILYYKSILANGPLGQYFRLLMKDKKYFVPTPDSMGISGNNNYSPANITISNDYSIALGCNTDTFNKLPNFIQSNISTAIKQTEKLFKGCLRSTTEVDNTLPLVDKKPQGRYDDEIKGELVTKSNGNFCVKDSYQYLEIKKVSKDIFASVKSELGDEDFRLYSDKKKYHPFSSDYNQSTSNERKIMKNIIRRDDVEEFELDLLGDVFESDKKRSATLKISNPSKDKYYAMNTNEGQLGS
jgi:hypothetical protein